MTRVVKILMDNFEYFKEQTISTSYNGLFELIRGGKIIDLKTIHL